VTLSVLLHGAVNERVCGTDNGSDIADALSVRMHERAHSLPPSVELVVSVLSAPANWAARDACRNTWFRFARNVERVNGSVALRFVVADANSSELERRLRFEQRLHGDIVRVQGADAYRRLTHKTLAAMRWLARSSSSFRWWLKTDDDSFVRLDRLVLQLRRYCGDAAQLCQWGFFSVGAQRISDRAHKWFDDVFAGDTYPPYALGTAYALSAEAVRRLVADDERAPLTMFANEDSAVGLWLERHNVTRIEALWNLLPFVSAYEDEQADKCEDSMIVRSHCGSSNDMYRILATYESCGRMCSCCPLTPRQKMRLRDDDHERRDWYARQRAERAAQCRQLYGDAVAARAVAAEPLKDAAVWINASLAAAAQR
jgi:hypothetical protein